MFYVNFWKSYFMLLCLAHALKKICKHFWFVNSHCIDLQILDWTVMICMALKYLHDQQILHKNLQPKVQMSLKYQCTIILGQNNGSWSSINQFCFICCHVILGGCMNILIFDRYYWLFLQSTCSQWPQTYKICVFSFERAYFSLHVEPFVLESLERLMNGIVQLYFKTMNTLLKEIMHQSISWT